MYGQHRVPALRCKRPSLQNCQPLPSASLSLPISLAQARSRRTSTAGRCTSSSTPTWRCRAQRSCATSRVGGRAVSCFNCAGRSSTEPHRIAAPRCHPCPSALAAAGAKGVKGAEGELWGMMNLLTLNANEVQVRARPFRMFSACWAPLGSCTLGSCLLPSRASLCRLQPAGWPWNLAHAAELLAHAAELLACFSPHADQAAHRAAGPGAAVPHRGGVAGGRGGGGGAAGAGAGARGRARGGAGP